MSFQSEKYSFDIAGDSDSRSILAIMEEEPSRGPLSIIHTRRPDPVKSFTADCDCEVYVIRDTENGEAATIGACDFRKLYINGEARQVGYFHGLRVAKKYRGKVPLSPFLKSLIDRNSGNGTACFIATALADNPDGQNFLEKKRDAMPSFVKICGYDVIALSTCRKARSIKGFSLRQADDSNVESIINYINEKGKGYLFYPTLDVAEVRAGRYPGLRVGDFYCLENPDGGIVAAGAAWDQSSYKQYIVQNYSTPIKFLNSISRATPFFGLPRLPKPGSNLEFFTLSFWSAENADIFNIFIDLVSFERNRYPFYLVGITEAHPFRNSLRKRPCITISSVLYVYDLENNQWLTQLSGKSRVPYLECGLL